MQAEGQDTIEELNCSVCMCLFQTPVTIECGHTFCRYCLLNSLRSKNVCPMCRKNLTYLSDRPQEDQTLSQIVSDFKAKLNGTCPEEGKNAERGINHVENVLLLDIRTSQLLLPFTSVRATFELQSPTLLARLDKFVARQESPFNRFGVISKLTFLKQLRYNVYECVVEGKHFCEISQEWVEKCSDNNTNEEVFFRNCNAKFIYEDYEFSPETLQPFYDRFAKVTDKKLLAGVYKIVNHEKLFSKTDTVAAYYSIMRVLAAPLQQKYTIAITFDKDLRVQYLTNFFKKLRQKETQNGVKKTELLSVDRESSLFKEGLLVFLVVLTLLLYFLNEAESTVSEM